MSWNYRVMRQCEKQADNDETYYLICSVYYDREGAVKGWSDGNRGPIGETFEEMSGDLAWIITALTKPVLDFKTGQEVEPAQMLADDIGKLMRDEPERFAPALPDKGDGQ